MGVYRDASEKRENAMIEYTISPSYRDEDVIRELAAMLAAFAATNGTMVKEQPTLCTSEIYSEVTLGLREVARKQKWQFSSCAFLCHWVLECVGFDGVSGIGRRRADNPLSRLAHHKLSEPVKADSVFESGDIIQLGTTNATAHVYVALADNEARGETKQESTAILGAHYGQEGIVNSAHHAVGGKVSLLPVARAGKTQTHGQRRAMRVLRLSRLFEETDDLSPFKVPAALYSWPGFASLRRRLLDP